MTRVRYLAALLGPTERRPAPLLRPPRRLFPHEPPPVEPLPPAARPPGEIVGESSTQEQIVGGPERIPAEPIGREPDGSKRAVVRPVLAHRLHTAIARSVPASPSRGAPPPEQVPEPPAEAARSRAELAPPRVAEAPPPKREATTSRPKIATDYSAPDSDRSVVDRRSATVLEPSRPRRSVASPPPRASAALRPAAAAATRPATAHAQAPRLHIGSIDVTVAPPPPAPREPIFEAPPAPVRQPPATFDPRGASMSRWFGLAQR